MSTVMVSLFLAVATRVRATFSMLYILPDPLSFLCIWAVFFCFLLSIVVMEIVAVASLLLVEVDDVPPSGFVLASDVAD